MRGLIQSDIRHRFGIGSLYAVTLDRTGVGCFFVIGVSHSGMQRCVVEAPELTGSSGAITLALTSYPSSLVIQAADIKVVNEAVRELFQTIIIRSKGFDVPDFRPGYNVFDGFVQRINGRLDFDLDHYLSWLTAHPHALPSTDEENAVRSFLAKEIMAATADCNLGHAKETDTYFLQYGVNFFNQSCTTLLIGGTIHQKCKDRGDFRRNLRLIAAGTQYNAAKSWILQPQGPVLLDAAYMIDFDRGRALRSH